MRKLLSLAGLAMFSLSIAAAESRLVLRDGTVLRGNFESGTSREIVFRDSNGVRRRFDVNQIQTLDFSGGYGNTSNVYGNDRDRNYNNGYNNTADRAYDNGRYAGPVYQTLPSGTEVSVRTNEAIDAQNATVGRFYSAVIERDVMGPEGRVVIPRGSDAQLVIRQVNEGGTLSSGNLALDLDSVRVNGRRYVVSTTDVKQSGDRAGIGKNRRTAEMVGGGAALGTLLGAIAGGGKGAVIGAIAGAAAGGTAQVLTKGKDIRVPAETVLNFRLDQPLELREAR